MQRFVAELSTTIEEAEFERAWRSDPSLGGFYRVFSAAIRRIDHARNIRWL